MGLAEDSWLRVREKPAASTDLIEAAINIDLSGQGKYEEAAQMQCELLEVLRRVLGAEHPGTLAYTGNLAYALRKRGKYEEAAQRQCELLEVERP